MTCSKTLRSSQQETILDALEDSERIAAEQALSYPENSAGRLMQREVVMAPEHWTVGQTIDFMRANDDLPEQFYHVVLVDPRLKPVAQVTLGKLMAARREVPLRDLTGKRSSTSSLSIRTRRTWRMPSISTT